jgi:general L-amino acid transport system substrate-binding protein
MAPAAFVAPKTGQQKKRLYQMNKKILSAVVGIAAVAGMGASAASAATLDDVKAKGFVQCGVSTGLAGFSAPNDAGDWSGIDVDLCRGVAAAVFGDATAVKFSPLSAKERFTALQSGEIDVLSRNTTWTMSRDTQLGLNFAGVNYYDGQGFMVRKSPRREFRAAAVGRFGLRADRHHHRAEPDRLLQGQ